MRYILDENEPPHKAVTHLNHFKRLLLQQAVDDASPFMERSFVDLHLACRDAVSGFMVRGFVEARVFRWWNRG